MAEEVVVGDEGKGEDGFVEVGGEVMPIRKSTLAAALRYSWFEVNREFNGVFYRALDKAGVSWEETRSAIALMGRHAEELGLSDRQVRGAWGIEKGVFNKAGDWKYEVFGVGNRAAVKAMVMKAGGGVKQRAVGSTEAGWYGGVFRASEFRFLIDDAVKLSKGKPDRVGIEEEIEWVAANLLEWPDFGTAPSRSAVKWWLAVMMDKSVARDFWSSWLSKRLAPGDVRGRRVRASALREPGEAEALDAADEESLRSRLGLS